MNEPRFIELLNLYVDQQLSPEEAAELEMEIQQNPVRHRTYQQYCRMQKACAQLFEHERTAAPASTALARAMAEADRKIVAFPDGATRRSIWPAGFSIAAVAAAACVAFVVVQQVDTNEPASGGNQVAVSSQSPSTPTMAIAPVAVLEERAPAVALASTDEFKRVFTVQPLRSAASPAERLFASGAETTQLLEWTRQVELKPLRKVSPEEFAFDVRTTADKPVTMPFSTPSSEEPATEMTVIMFTK